MTLMKYMAFCSALLVLNAKTMAQKRNTWALPKHQIQVQAGMSNNTDDLGQYESAANVPYLGVVYYYNFLPQWFVSADFQYIQGGFKMGVQSYDAVNDKNIFTYPSNDNPWTLPLVRLTEKRTTTESEIKKSDYVKVSSSEGLYRRTHYNINGGYMRVTNRNMLRIGVGVSYFRLESRDILNSVVTNNSSLGLLHLRYLDIKDMAFNAKISYDFFITAQFSVGLQLNTLLTSKGFEPTARQAGITFGYSPTGFRVRKSPPRA